MGGNKREKLALIRIQNGHTLTLILSVKGEAKNGREDPRKDGGS
jgi:hypothetical protein